MLCKHLVSSQYAVVEENVTQIETGRRSRSCSAKRPSVGNDEGGDEMVKLATATPIGICVVTELKRRMMPQIVDMRISEICKMICGR